MGALLTAYWWVDKTLDLIWPVLMVCQIFVRAFSRRLQRGKYWRWITRTFGPGWADFPVLMSIALFSSFFTYVLDSEFGSNVFWGFILVTLVIDWITGSEDPPWRRWSEKGKEILEKLRIEPAPEPVLIPK